MGDIIRISSKDRNLLANLFSYRNKNIPQNIVDLIRQNTGHIKFYKDNDRKFGNGLRVSKKWIMTAGHLIPHLLTLGTATDEMTTSLGFPHFKTLDSSYRLDLRSLVYLQDLDAAFLKIQKFGNDELFSFFISPNYYPTEGEEMFRSTLRNDELKLFRNKVITSSEKYITTSTKEGIILSGKEFESNEGDSGSICFDRGYNLWGPHLGKFALVYASKTTNREYKPFQDTIVSNIHSIADRLRVL